MFVKSMQRAHLVAQTQRNFSRHLKAFATLDPKALSDKQSGMNLVGGEWVKSAEQKAIIDPLTGKNMYSYWNIDHANAEDVDPFIDSMLDVPISGLHNPLKNKERYIMLGEVSRRVAEVLRDPEVFDFFVDATMRAVPKSRGQTEAEIRVTRAFFDNFSGDQVRFLAEGTQFPGDHQGQSATGYRWPFGGVGVIAPFNFPIEIAVLQMMGAVYMGNKPLVKPDTRCGFPLEQWIRMLHYCGLPTTDMDFINCDGPTMEKILVKGRVRNTLFTGSSAVGEHLSKKLNGKVRLEDGGFDWKIIGPDVPASQTDRDYVAWQCDHDAYGHSGQKCSAQSMLFVHKNWTSGRKKTDLFEKMKLQAAKRNLKDLTIGPVLSWNNERIQAHVDAVSSLAGAEVLFGGHPLKKHTIPEIYGAYEPTAVLVPIRHFKGNKKFQLLTTELFGPFQVVIEYGDKDIQTVIDIINDMPNHLTAACVSNDRHFVDNVLSKTVNGTQYEGLRARTTGAPQNHWFGPCGDPRGAGIGTPYAIRHTWSHHREIVSDIGPVPDGWEMPNPI